MDRLNQTGLTLTEVTVVTILAAIVMLGLVGFYVNSQGTWMDASSQAITQREATTLMENISEHVHQASAAIVSGSQLELLNEDGTTYAFWWNVPGDSTIHEGPDRTPGNDRGASIASIVEQFQCAGSDSLVSVSLVMRSAQGDRVRLASQFELVNRISN